jgi:endonuclease G
MKRLSTLAVLVFMVCHLDAQKADILLPSKIAREQIIHHKGFSLSYNTSYLMPSWVSYKVTKAQVNLNDNFKGKYVPDPFVTTRSASKKDYKQGGYLMAQFVNYLDVKQIPDAAKETFYLSNIAPMKLAYYNHIWLKTEQIIRLWTTGTDGLYIVCGPILTDAPFPTMGSNNVSVPKRYYKAVYDPKNQKAIGFIFKNGTSSGKIKSYTVSIDAIEKETGIDLFPSLEGEAEKNIEGNLNTDDWDFEVLDK